MGYPGPELHPQVEELNRAAFLIAAVADRMQAIRASELHERLSEHLAGCEYGPLLLAFRIGDYDQIGRLLWSGVAQQITAEEDDGKGAA